MELEISEALTIEEVADDLGISTEKLIEDLAEGMKDFEKGRSISMEELEKELKVDLVEK